MKLHFQQAARVAMLAAAAVAIGAGGAWAYPSYDDPATPGVDDWCSGCHNDFKSVGSLHQSHLLNLQITGSPGVIDTNCNVCHSSGGGSTPVMTFGSNLVQGNGLGCAGCHGQDYGETVLSATAPYNYQGLPKASGYGLRLVHASAGVTECATCHAPNPFTPLTEQDAPPYYTMGVSKLGNPCLSTQEDLSYDPDAKGLDNDGNGLRDYPDDPNCLLPTTTTTSTSTTTTTLPASCAPAPVGGCIAAEKAKLQVSEKAAGKEKVKFQLVKLTTNTVQADFGDPLNLGGTSYALCVYDQANVLVGSYLFGQAGQDCASGKPCWQDAKGLGYKYSDKYLLADGISKAQLSGGVAGKGKVKVLGKNTESTLPTGIAALLSGDTAATAQFVTNDAQCFGMALPTVKKNDGLTFQAQAP